MQIPTKRHTTQFNIHNSFDHVSKPGCGDCPQLIESDWIAYHENLFIHDGDYTNAPCTA